MSKNSWPIKTPLRKTIKADFDIEPDRYEFRENDASAPPCPYGNRYAWIGFDRTAGEYVRFTKSVVRGGRLKRVNMDQDEVSDTLNVYPKDKPLISNDLEHSASLRPPPTPKGE